MKETIQNKLRIEQIKTEMAIDIRNGLKTSNMIKLCDQWLNSSIYDYKNQMSCPYDISSMYNSATLNLTTQNTKLPQLQTIIFDSSNQDYTSNQKRKNALPN